MHDPRFEKRFAVDDVAQIRVESDRRFLSVKADAGQTVRQRDGVQFLHNSKADPLTPVRRQDRDTPDLARVLEINPSGRAVAIPDGRHDVHASRISIVAFEIRRDVLFGNEHPFANLPSAGQERISATHFDANHDAFRATRTSSVIALTSASDSDFVTAPGEAGCRYPG